MRAVSCGWLVSESRYGMVDLGWFAAVERHGFSEATLIVP